MLMQLHACERSVYRHPVIVPDVCQDVDIPQDGVAPRCKVERHPLDGRFLLDDVRLGLLARPDRSVRPVCNGDQQVPGIADSDHQQQHDHQEQAAQRPSDIPQAEEHPHGPHTQVAEDAEARPPEQHPKPDSPWWLVLKPSAAGRTTRAALTTATAAWLIAVAAASPSGARITSATSRMTKKSASMMREYGLQRLLDGIAVRRNALEHRQPRAGPDCRQPGTVSEA